MARGSFLPGYRIKHISRRWLVVVPLVVSAFLTAQAIGGNPAPSRSNCIRKSRDSRLRAPPLTQTVKRGCWHRYWRGVRWFAPVVRSGEVFDTEDDMATAWHMGVRHQA